MEMVTTILLFILLFLIGAYILQSEKLKKPFKWIKFKIKQFKESYIEELPRSYLYDEYMRQRMEQVMKGTEELKRGKLSKTTLPEWHAEGKRPEWAMRVMERLWLSFVLIMGVLTSATLIWGFMHRAGI